MNWSSNSWSPVSRVTSIFRSGARQTRRSKKPPGFVGAGDFRSTTSSALPRPEGTGGSYSRGTPTPRDSNAGPGTGASPCRRDNYLRFSAARATHLQRPKTRLQFPGSFKCCKTLRVFKIHHNRSATDDRLFSLPRSREWTSLPRTLAPSTFRWTWPSTSSGLGMRKA